ncbi:hypothetical protein L1987_85571 [Smallanthus sonchifolius]|uniref:Uncharacterized protein n=1 Tax=Smallanthus sonchifolius TaxID=185202 RepID=A0ACB8XWX1_9ASTR|nr:hypothetical protein L1987_85571 [Smallanthus sonchifolius]
MRDDESRMSITTFDFQAEEYQRDVDEEAVEVEDESEKDVEDGSEEEVEVIVILWTMKKNGEESLHKEFTKVIPRSCYEPVEFTKTRKLIFWKTKFDQALWDSESRQVVNHDEFAYHECLIVKDYVEILSYYKLKTCLRFRIHFCFNMIYFVGLFEVKAFVYNQFYKLRFI